MRDRAALVAASLSFDSTEGKKMLCQSLELARNRTVARIIGPVFLRMFFNADWVFAIAIKEL